MPSALWDWDQSTMETTRRMVHGAIEETVGEGMNVNRPDADTLIAQAQALGISPLHLRTWIYEHHPKLMYGLDGADDWSGTALGDWARKHGYLRSEGEPPAEAPASLGYSRDGDVVTLRMKDGDWSLLLFEMGYAWAAAGEADRAIRHAFMELTNRLNAGNPHYRQFAIPEAKP